MTVQQTIQLPGYARLRQDRHVVRSFWFASSDPPPPDDDTDRLDAFLEHALNLPKPAREAYLERISQDNPALRRTLDALLEGIENDVPPGFLKPLPSTRSILARIRKVFGDPPATEQSEE